MVKDVLIIILDMWKEDKSLFGGAAKHVHILEKHWYVEQPLAWCDSLNENIVYIKKIYAF